MNIPKKIFYNWYLVLSDFTKITNRASIPKATKTTNKVPILFTKLVDSNRLKLRSSFNRIVKYFVLKRYP